jgi:hypothetical protein
MIYRIYTFLNKLLLTFQFRVWLHTHTMQEFEARMIALGCVPIHTRTSTIYTTPNGLGKIEVTDSEVIINGKADQMLKQYREPHCKLCDTMTPHSYERHLAELSK